MKHPKFGERVMNTFASHNNPTKYGLFVRVGHIPFGRINAGMYYELTDGKRSFWKVDPKAIVRITEGVTGDADQQSGP